MQGRSWGHDSSLNQGYFLGPLDPWGHVSDISCSR